MIAKNLKVKGKSDLGEALLSSLHLLSTDSTSPDTTVMKSNYVVLITDGHPNIGVTDTYGVLNLVKNAASALASLPTSLTFLTVGIGSRQPAGILEGLAELEAKVCRSGKWWCEKEDLRTLPRAMAEIAVWVKYGVIEVEIGEDVTRVVRVGGEEYALVGVGDEVKGKWRNRQTGEEGKVEFEVAESPDENVEVRVKAVDCVLNHKKLGMAFSSSPSSLGMLKHAFVEVLELLKRAKGTGERGTEDRILGKGLKSVAKRLEEERIRVVVREGNRMEVERRKSGLSGERNCDGEQGVGEQGVGEQGDHKQSETLSEDGQGDGQRIEDGKFFNMRIGEESYKVNSSIGAGAFGTIYSATDSVGRIRALKRIQNPFTSSYLSLQTEREIRILRHFKGERGLVEVWGWGRQGDDVWLVMELVGTDLGRVIGSSAKLGEGHVLKIAYGLVRGVAKLHEGGVMHRDLKPGNILVDGKCNVKVADFGMARGVEGVVEGEGRAEGGKNNTEYVVTRYYRAPELLLGITSYTAAVDVWSIGCILGELVSRRPLFPGSNYVEQMNMVLGVVGKRIEDVSEYVNEGKVGEFFRDADEGGGGRIGVACGGGVEEVLKSCLRVWDGGRKTAVEVMEMSYFDGIRRDKDIRRVREGERFAEGGGEEGAGERLKVLCGEGGA
ncbi:hypothetical protein TrCOL_g3205 [Triparma columacea]|uniref:Mitogen-activated protein kinase n=1 Tax=Triparma columacea TaxID=722753 RepID=A0A9W7GBS7_9STRA|nr:hypothetical protein TrCOL_g3205 [Triparma columacea]